jgi:hypothetical protein
MLMLLLRPKYDSKPVEGSSSKMLQTPQSFDNLWEFLKGVKDHGRGASGAFLVFDVWI